MLTSNLSTSKFLHTPQTNQEINIPYRLDYICSANLAISSTMILPVERNNNAGCKWLQVANIQKPIHQPQGSFEFTDKIEMINSSSPS